MLLNLFGRLQETNPGDAGNEGGGGGSSPSLEETIAAQFDAIEARGSDEPTIDDAGTGTGGDEAENAGRARDAKGKFSKPGVAGKPASGEVTAELTKPAEGADSNTPAPVASKHPEAPKSWSNQERADWDKLPENYRAAAHRREQNFFNGIEQYKGKAQHFDALDAVIRPHQKIFEASGQNAVENVGALLSLQQTLYTGSDQEKLGTLLQIVQQSGIKPEVLLEAVQNPQQQPAQDPRYDSLAKRLEQAEARLGEAALRPVQSEVERFFGDPKNEHIGEPGLVDEMERLIKSGVAKDVQQAYDKACRLSDTVQAKVAAKAAEAESKAQAERAAAEAKRKADLAAKAQKASSMNVRTRGVTTGTPTKKGTLDDTIGATYDAIAARQGA